MNYFSIDTIRLIVNYQWKLMKPKIIGYLFIPFILNMTIYNIYCVYIYEGHKSDPEDPYFLNLMRSAQVILMLFTL